MLSVFPIHPSLAAADLARARRWYEVKLGLVPSQDLGGVLVYSVGSSNFAVYETPSAGTAKNTVAIWNVADLRADMARLRGRGVVFEDYDVGDFRTVDGIMSEPEGDLNAWFTDSEGNIIGLVQRAGDTRESAVSPMLAASDLRRARAWYEEKLGFVPVEEYEGILLVYQSGAGRFSVYETSLAGTAKNTVAVWRVDGLRSEMAVLRGGGVDFEDYDFGDLRTIDGVLTDPEGGLNAWFTDSEGNILGLAEDRGQIPG
jgi:catechol 2,3-dioxygenase-like lactoylglutathione lyase family enzyme